MHPMVDPRTRALDRLRGPGCRAHRGQRGAEGGEPDPQHRLPHPHLGRSGARSRGADVFLPGRARWAWVLFRVLVVVCWITRKPTGKKQNMFVGFPYFDTYQYLPFSITAPKENSLQTGNQKVTFRDTKRGIIGRTCFLVSFRGAFLRPKKEENIRWSRLGGEQFSQLFWRSGAGTELHLHTPPPFEDHKLQIPIRNWLTCPDPRPTGA